MSPGVVMHGSERLDGVGRQHLMATTFVEIVDALVGGFDVTEVMSGLSARCVQLMSAAAAIMLWNGDGDLQVVTASNVQAEKLQLLQIRNDEGPCLDCVATGTIIVSDDLAADDRWPSFRSACVRSGFSVTSVVPLRLGDVVLGCLQLLAGESEPLTQADIALAQAFADVASIAIVQAQAAQRSEVRTRQLQEALVSRVVIEQAKGMIAEHSKVEMTEAFSRLRAFARRTNSRLGDVARSLVAGTLSVDEVSRRRPPSARAGDHQGR